MPYNLAGCGGNYSSASGILSSPSYPNPYPRQKDCIYLISQPPGAYVNFTMTNMDINCHEKYESGSDYLEMRDGYSEEAPLIGRFCGNGSNVPNYVQTTQNNLLVRWEKHL